MEQKLYIRKRRRRRRARPLKVLFCVAVCLLVSALERPVQGPRAARTIRTVSESFDFQQFRIPVAAEADSGRTVYPYSVIPGGVHDREELADAIHRDPVVAGHYAGFKIENAHIVRVPNPQWVHVSYRIQNKIFWTAKRVQLAQGEKLISDGQVLARTRCGNQVSAVPQEPVSAVEPPPEVFNTPVIPVDDLPLLAETIATTPFPLTDEARLPLLESLINPPDLITLENRYFDNIVVPFVPTPYFPPIYLLDEFPNPPEVPEPGTLILIGTGLAIPVFARLMARRKSRRNSNP